MTNFYGLSEKQRLKEYAKDPKRNKYKPSINCLKDEDCRECKDRTNCAIIGFRKMRGWTKDRYTHLGKRKIYGHVRLWNVEVIRFR